MKTSKTLKIETDKIYSVDYVNNVIITHQIIKVTDKRIYVTPPYYYNDKSIPKHIFETCMYLFKAHAEEELEHHKYSSNLRKIKIDAVTKDIKKLLLEYLS